MEIAIQTLPEQQRKPLFTDSSSLGFGRIFTDHMFTMRYHPEKGWHEPKIEPYRALEFEPATIVFHYGQEIFEGTKAFVGEDGQVRLFRTDRNIARMNRSAERMCMPRVPEDVTLQAIEELVRVDRRWIPKERGTSLYIRPTMIGTDPFLGVRASDTYLFFVILSPVGAYYAEGFNPVSLLVDKRFTRAATGGTGEAKAGGNYGGSLLAGRIAAEKGCAQVLWLDAKEHRWVEEVGAMNIWFAFGNKLVTPPLTGTILPGVTRESLVELAPKLGYEVEQRQVAIDEVLSGIKSGEITEVFGSGTAAVVSPVGKIVTEEETVVINDNKVGPVSQHLFDELTGIQMGAKPDPFGWVRMLDK